MFNMVQRIDAYVWKTHCLQHSHTIYLSSCICILAEWLFKQESRQSHFRKGRGASNKLDFVYGKVCVSQFYLLFFPLRYACQVGVVSCMLPHVAALLLLCVWEWVVPGGQGQRGFQGKSCSQGKSCCLLAARCAGKLVRRDLFTYLHSLDRKRT